MKRKIIVLALILQLIWTSVAFAWLPAAFAITGALVYGGVTVLDTYIAAASIVWFCAGVGVYAYNKKHGQGTQVTSTGDIRASGKVTWVELGPNNTLPVKESDITAKISWDKLIAEFNKDKAAFKQKYPNLGSILEDSPDAYNYNMAMKANVPVNSIVYYNGKFYRVNQQTDSNVEHSNNYTIGNVNVEVNNTVLWFRREVLPSGNAKGDRYLVTQIAAPPSSPTTPEKFKYRATGYETAQSEAAAQYKGDIDQLIKDAPNIVHFEDPVTGQEAIPNAATQAQINAALAAQRAASQAQQAANSAQSAANNARAAADAARARADAAAAASAANPQDSALRQSAEAAAAAADAAERAADAADAALKKLQAEQAEREAKDEKERSEEEAGKFTPPGDNTYSPEIEAPEKKGLSALLDSIFNSSPLLSMIRGISVTGSNPQSQFACTVWGRELVFDFAQWSSLLSGIGTAFLGVCHIAAIYLVFRRDE